MTALRALARPGLWAIVAALGLFVALVLTPAAPAWLFWGATALSCAGAFTRGVLRQRR